MSYPATAGFKDAYGSKRAAIAVTKSGKKAHDEEIVQSIYKAIIRPMGADEAWEASGRSIDLHSFRSRTSELCSGGTLVKLPEVRAVSITGKSVSSYVWADYYRPQVSYIFQADGQGVLWAL